MERRGLTVNLGPEIRSIDSWRSCSMTGATRLRRMVRPIERPYDLVAYRPLDAWRSGSLVRVGPNVAAHCLLFADAAGQSGRVHSCLLRHGIRVRRSPAAGDAPVWEAAWLGGNKQSCVKKGSSHDKNDHFCGRPRGDDAWVHWMQREGLVNHGKDRLDARRIDDHYDGKDGRKERRQPSAGQLGFCGEPCRRACA